MPFDFSRRQFLKPLGMFVAGAAVSRSMPLISNLLGDPVEAQTNTVYIRQDIANWSQNQIRALQRGIKVMQSRPDTDPTSWIYQANIHGTSDSRNLLAWMTCQHGTNFFFPWHRMYLYYFERILRKASGSRSLALPYWNYSDSTAGLVLPAPFRNPANSSNPLYVSQRDANINKGQPLPAQDVSYSNAFSYTNFESSSGSGASFGGQQVSVPTHFNSPHGQLETKPHDQVHVDVGGWMGDPDTAARDPIFWLHHANIDRLWEGWLQLDSGRVNPTTNSVWMNTSFTFFDENGNSVKQSGKDILDTVRQLNYKYDNLPSLQKAAVKTELSATKSARQQQELVKPSSAPLTLPVPGKQELVSQSNPQQVTQLGEVPVTVSVAVAAQSSRTLIPQSTPPRVVLNVEGIEYNPSNAIPYEIYINQPQGVTLNTASANYIGKLALFAYPQGGTFSIDITDVVDQSQGANISVTFAPPTGIAPGAAARQSLSSSSSSSISFQQVTVTRV